MEDLIKLKSRYGSKNYLKKMIKKDGSESLTYILKTDTPYFRVGNAGNGNRFIDPSGGPMIVVGDELEEAKAVIKSIDFIEGYGWTVTFEKNDISSQQE